MSDNQLPDFERPPVVENVLGVQFDAIPNFTAAHAGIFWSEFLGEDWFEAREAPALNLIDEKYGATAFARPTMVLMERSPNRIQILNRNEDRMIQIQDTRFVLNWKRAGRDYARYTTLLGEFRSHLQDFVTFAQRFGCPSLKLTRWEVTYVNHIDRGALWNVLQDWDSIFPGLFGPLSDLSDQSLESFDSQWQVGLQKDKGRMRIQLKHIRKGSEHGEEAIDFRLSATGMLGPDIDLETGMELGHSAIVTRFSQMTSDMAHAHWGRTQ